MQISQKVTANDHMSALLVDKYCGVDPLGETALIMTCGAAQGAATRSPPVTAL